MQQFIRERCRSCDSTGRLCRFGEYETLNFFVATRPEDMALITSLYRSSVDGRRWMFEAILSDDAKYDLPDHFTSRSAEVAQVYFKSLGVRMDTVIDDEEFIGYFEDKNTLITYQVHQSILVITVEQRRLLKKVQKAYRKYLKKYPNMIDDFDHIWDWIMDHITMHNKKKLLNGDIKKLFRDNLTEFTQDCKEKVI